MLVLDCCGEGEFDLSDSMPSLFMTDFTELYLGENDPLMATSLDATSGAVLEGILKFFDTSIDEIGPTLEGGITFLCPDTDLAVAFV